MPDEKPQSFSNHTRFDPLFHFFIVPAMAFNLVVCVVHSARHITPFTIWQSVMAIVLFAVVFFVRIYALRVQDRVIRLEERIRLSQLCREPMQFRIGELSMAQLIALRFASNEELPELAEQALNENMTPKQIKQAIASWRADRCRI